MKILRKYFISGILTTIGCLIIYATDYLTSGIALISITFSLTSIKNWKGSIIFKLPKWHPLSFFKGVTLLFGVSLFCIVYVSYFKEFLALFKKWYFMGTLWLFLLSILAYCYFKDKDLAQPGNTADRQATPASR
jgi:hypothetical protein